YFSRATRFRFLLHPTRSKRANVHYWHLADITLGAQNVGFRGKARIALTRTAHHLAVNYANRIG
ncbi:MAG: hypothetical protein WCF86_23220, partial [Pseudolabrys sp.]